MMNLYIHFPFCKQKCRYCDFPSFPGLEDRMEAYGEAILREAEMNRGEVTEPLENVYFGGGTPSLFPPELLSRLIRGLKSVLPMEKIREWTAEANPGTLTSAWLGAARENGINRLSLGMQAAQPELLWLLGRIHSPEEVIRGVQMARAAGFENLNLDLIFGLPGQTLAQWEESLDFALHLSPEHLSAYGLIPEEGTPLQADLESGKYILPEVEEEREMYETLLRRTREKDYIQYEISNFAKPGYACRHNIGYWEHTPYLGLGLSAASLLRVNCGAEGMSGLRRSNTAKMDAYLQGILEGSPLYAEVIPLSPAEARFETMMLGLRMNRGVSEREFLARHGVSLEACYGSRLRKLAAEGLLVREEDAWKLTRQGMDLQNMALIELMD